MTHKVFVYGTLKRCEPNHHWLTSPDNGVGTFIAEGKTKTKYPLVIASKYNIPFLLKCPGEGHNVVGEVYDVDDKILSKLDILEDHPNFYVRELDDVIIKKGESPETIKCWIYFLLTFKRDLLNKEMFANYSSSGSHGLAYLDRSRRDPNYHARVDVKDN